MTKNIHDVHDTRGEKCIRHTLKQIMMMMMISESLLYLQILLSNVSVICFNANCMWGAEKQFSSESFEFCLSTYFLTEYNLSKRKL